MLEILAHANIGRVPETHQYVIAEVSEDVSVEILEGGTLPEGWDLENTASARARGDKWLNESRSAILIVPSVIARLDRNALVNPHHPDAKKLIVSEPIKVIWDKRLFQ
jgi:RES domain-containing protein